MPIEVPPPVSPVAQALPERPNFADKVEGWETRHVAFKDKLKMEIDKRGFKDAVYNPEGIDGVEYKSLHTESYIYGGDDKKMRDQLKKLADFLGRQGNDAVKQIMDRSITYNVTKDMNFRSYMKSRLYDATLRARPDAKVIWHETSHLLDNNGVVRTKGKQWLKVRAGGTYAEPMKKICPWLRDNENAYRDKFVDPYVGKLYNNGDTEVFSMGMQNMTSPALAERFSHADFDHFSFILGVLRGVI